MLFYVHHCHKVANMVFATCPLSEVPSFKCKYALQTLCLKNITLTEQLQSAMEAIYGAWELVLPTELTFSQLLLSIKCTYSNKKSEMHTTDMQLHCVHV